MTNVQRSRRQVRLSRALGIALTPQGSAHLQRPYAPGEHGRDALSFTWLADRTTSTACGCIRKRASGGYANNPDVQNILVPNILSRP